jgi:hypothetical protein
MITSAQATQYLDQMLGVGAPGFLVDAAVADVTTYETALQAAGYTASTIVRIECITVALLVAAGDPKRVSSQHASSGAARSFKFHDGDLSKLRRSLAALDTAGVMAALIGPDPANSGFLMVVC